MSIVLFNRDKLWGTAGSSQNKGLTKLALVSHWKVGKQERKIMACMLGTINNPQVTLLPPPMFSLTHLRLKYQACV